MTTDHPATAARPTYLPATGTVRYPCPLACGWAHEEPPGAGPIAAILDGDAPDGVAAALDASVRRRAATTAALPATLDEDGSRELGQHLSRGVDEVTRRLAEITNPGWLPARPDDEALIREALAAQGTIGPGTLQQLRDRL